MTETMPNQEILDATQDAVLNAATSVANAFETTAQELGVHGAEPFYMEAEFWVGMAFVLVVIGLFKPVGSVFVKLLRDRGETIATRIQEAVSLKEEAQKLLADYERKFRNVEKEAAEILAKSEREIDTIKKETIAKLEDEIKIKEHDAKLRLKAMEETATQEISDKTTKLTIAIVKKALNESLDQKMTSKLIDKSIDNLKEIA